jgi:hypothetical protein
LEAAGAGAAEAGAETVATKAGDEEVLAIGAAAGAAGATAIGAAGAATAGAETIGAAALAVEASPTGGAGIAEEPLTTGVGVKVGAIGVFV